MNLKLISTLSLIGLALALADVFFIPIGLEPILWLAVFLFVAYAIARACRTGRFANGFLLGFVNSLWITATHVLFVARYLPRHPRELDTIDKFHTLLHVSWSAREIMSVTGPVSGIVSGLIIGVFAVIAGMMMKPHQIELSGPHRPVQTD